MSVFRLYTFTDRNKQNCRPVAKVCIVGWHEHIGLHYGVQRVNLFLATLRLFGQGFRQLSSVHPRTGTAQFGTACAQGFRCFDECSDYAYRPGTQVLSGSGGDKRCNEAFGTPVTVDGTEEGW